MNKPTLPLRHGDRLQPRRRNLPATSAGWWYSWEDEPEDRNPFDSAVRNRQWIEARLRS
jgi:hypothetical protein